MRLRLAAHDASALLVEAPREQSFSGEECFRFVRAIDAQDHTAALPCCHWRALAGAAGKSGLPRALREQPQLLLQWEYSKHS
jgi:hypothetical protein